MKQISQLLTAVLVLFVAGCGGGSSSPGTSSSPSPSASVSPSPSPSPSPQPTPTVTRFTTNSAPNIITLHRAINYAGPPEHLPDGTQIYQFKVRVYGSHFTDQGVWSIRLKNAEQYAKSPLPGRESFAVPLDNVQTTDQYLDAILDIPVVITQGLAETATYTIEVFYDPTGTSGIDSATATYDGREIVVAPSDPKALQFTFEP